MPQTALHTQQSQYYTNYCTSATTNYYVPTWTSQYNTYAPTITVSNTGWFNNATTVNTYTDQIWIHWVQNTSAYMSDSRVTSYQPDPEVLAAAQERLREQQEQHVAARTRARVLLEEFLSDEQKVELEHKGRFHVVGSRGRRYCIRTSGQAGNVDLLKADGGVQATLCCHPRGALPDGDAWLMQMVEIRHNEDHFLATANIHRGSLPRGYALAA